MFRCPRAPFSISLSHYFSFRSKRSLVAARNTKEKINFRIASSVGLLAQPRPMFVEEQELKVRCSLRGINSADQCRNVAQRRSTKSAPLSGLKVTLAPSEKYRNRTGHSHSSMLLLNGYPLYPAPLVWRSPMSVRRRVRSRNDIQRKSPGSRVAARRGLWTNPQGVSIGADAWSTSDRSSSTDPIVSIEDFLVSVTRKPHTNFAGEPPKGDLVSCG
jgi:hypothetical protein